MPKLVPSRKFLKDLEKSRSNASMRKKTAKTLTHLENNPLHPGFHLERIVNDPAAWSVRVERKCRISFDPEVFLPSGNPDWTTSLLLLRLLDHDDLYKFPR